MAPKDPHEPTSPSGRAKETSGPDDPSPDRPPAHRTELADVKDLRPPATAPADIRPALVAAQAGTVRGGAEAAPPVTSAAPNGSQIVIDGVPLGGVPVEIGLRSLARVNSFEIRLAPEDLGRIDVKLDIDDQGGVKAHLVVDRPETLSFLQRDSASLERALDQAGLKPADNGIAFSLRDGSGGGSGSMSGQNQAGDGQPQRQGARAPNPSADPTPAPAHPIQRRAVWARPSGVDLHI